MNLRSFRPIALFAFLMSLSLLCSAAENQIRVTAHPAVETFPVQQLQAFRTEREATSNFTPIFARDHTCVLNAMSCNSSVSGALTTHDCDGGDGFFVDFWTFSGTAGQTVTVNATSAAFDTFLLLFDPEPEVVATDDDGGAGTNSRIVFPLGESGVWAIGVNNFFANDLGNYGLSLSCTGGGGGSNRPTAPSNLTAAGASSSEIDLFWNDNSNNETQFRVEVRSAGAAFQDIGSVPANSVGASISGLQTATTYDFRVRARNGAGNSAYSNVASATTNGGSTGPCVPSATVLCLNNDRFRVETTWRRPNGQTGVGTGVELTNDTGYFWFFNEANVEMVVKVLNACGLAANRYWVFAGGLTNVEVNLTVTDTQTGAIRIYSNPQESPFQPIQDTQAFATCP